MKRLEIALKEFSTLNNIKQKGQLALVLVITRRAKNEGLPLDPKILVTKSGGQVAGLSKNAVQKILRDHEIQQILASEGGRTSRGNIERMEKYVDFLNALGEREDVDLEIVEEWWIARVREYFASKPITMRFDPSKSLRTVVREILQQARKRQEKSPGSTFEGTVLQHLVGAKLNLLTEVDIKHHGASVADEQLGRNADYLVNDVAIHVTTAPSEALAGRCKKNLQNGLKPIVITTKADFAEGLYEQMGIGDRVDIFDAEQFIAGNFFELGKFSPEGRKTTADHLVKEYNDIVEQCETDPSLRIGIEL